jgi:hypothetical protein
LELRVVYEVGCKDFQQTLDYGSENSHNFQLNEIQQVIDIEEINLEERKRIREKELQREEEEEEMVAEIPQYVLPSC